MYPVPTICPVCGDTMAVTRLQCPHCDTTLEGRFALGRFHQLSPEQLSFAELFLRCEGKLSWAAEELGVSYPTVRARLDDVIRALGYEVRQETPAEEKQRRAGRRQAILNDLAAGTISAEEAAELLKKV
ncbi:MAG: DUF2089 domain-containing protein [Anaerolineae bacterium]|nr:DUF2089 domain-containing protein [Anaerolineae bacterium]